MGRWGRWPIIISCALGSSNLIQAGQASGGLAIACGLTGGACMALGLCGLIDYARRLR